MADRLTQLQDAVNSVRRNNFYNQLGKGVQYHNYILFEGGVHSEVTLATLFQKRINITG